jgi:hypothetical protein
MTSEVVVRLPLNCRRFAARRGALLSLPTKERIGRPRIRAGRLLALRHLRVAHNDAKNDMSHEEFVALCQRVVDHHR